MAAALVDTLVRQLQTLTNVIASLREGDYSFRARGANAHDPLGELAGEVNALADLLQGQRDILGRVGREIGRAHV